MEVTGPDKTPKRWVCPVCRVERWHVVGRCESIDMHVEIFEELRAMAREAKVGG